MYSKNCPHQRFTLTDCRENVQLAKGIVIIHRIRLGEPGLSIPPRYNGAVSYGAKIGLTPVLAEQRVNLQSIRNFRGRLCCVHIARTHAIGYFWTCCEQNPTWPNFLPMANQIWREDRVLPISVQITLRPSKAMAIYALRLGLDALYFYGIL